MFNPIRELIAENKIAQALASCGDLDLTPANRSRLISLRRRWDLLAEQFIAQTREERLLRLEENGVVEDLLKWLDQMEYSQQAKEEWSVKVTHTKQGTGTGAIAGTGDGSVKSQAKWLWIGAAVIALLAVTWMMWPPAKPGPNPTAKVEDAREFPEETEPATPPVKEEPTPPVKEDPPATRPTRPGQITLKPGGLVAIDPGKIDVTKIDPSRVQLNPDIRLNRETLRKMAAANALMTTGQQVDIAVAVYQNKSAPTKYDAAMSKDLVALLDRKVVNMDIAYDVLTQKFHDDDLKERLFSHGIIENKRLTAERARYLLLVDAQEVSGSSGVFMRLCLYDVDRNKSFSKNKRYPGKFLSKLQVNYLYSYALSYLQEMKNNGILK